MTISIVSTCGFKLKDEPNEEGVQEENEVPEEN